ncbi:MAG: Re/Si-specific NAD(P)(+) transhydrogenase subunit alpha [Deltaproteobacteria bacterium]|nr:Re/Si-specific NAD(P)(+) transhydrogenase subunit alpha [Deltaproteobacteria bacterium]
MKIAITKESLKDEKRVALTPDVVKKLIRDKHSIVIQKGAGSEAGFIDAAYEKAGATLCESREEAWKDAEVILRINKPTDEEIAAFPEGVLLISFLSPLFEPGQMKKIAERKILSFSMDAVPRTTRAQSMDALSSQANLAGYKAVLIAADRMPKIMPMLMTAAGTIQPAKVLVLGAGVAGLSAIATARRLGASVHAFDVRPVVEEQVKSLGAKFLKIDTGESGEGTGGYAKALSEEAQKLQTKKLGEFATQMDIIITTAAIPGRAAPRLIERDAIEAMSPGSVVVDMAAGSGGNVDGSKPDEEVDITGTLILGPTNLASEVPQDASQMFAKNIVTLFDLMCTEGDLDIDWEDDILIGCCITKDGEIVHERTKDIISKL